MAQILRNKGRVIFWKSAWTIQEIQAYSRVHIRLCIRKRKFKFISNLNFVKINENTQNQNRKVFHIIVYFITILITLKFYK